MLSTLQVIRRNLNPFRHCIAIVGVALLMFTWAGCRGNSTRVALLTPFTGEMTGGSVYTAAVLDGHKCGLRVHFDTPLREDDLGIQLSQFQQASKDHFEVIAIAPIQMRAFRNPVERVSNSGTPIIVIGDDLGIRNPNVAYVLGDEQLAGKLAADKIAELLHGIGNVAVMGIDFSKPKSLLREQSFEQELSTQHKNIHVIKRVNATTNLFQEQQSAADILEESTQIDGIVALSAPATRGAFYALKAKYVHPHLHLIGFDQDLLIPLIDHELDAVIGPTADQIGEIVARLACDRINGKTWSGPYILRPTVITPENYAASDFDVRIGRRGWWEGEE